MPPLIADRGAVLVLLRRRGALEEGYWHGPIEEYDLSGNIFLKARPTWVTPAVNGLTRGQEKVAVAI